MPRAGRSPTCSTRGMRAPWPARSSRRGPSPSTCGCQRISGSAGSPGSWRRAAATAAASTPSRPCGAWSTTRSPTLPAASFPGADYIVAVAHAGIPWAKTLAERLDLPLAYVRAGARAAGGPLVECSPGRGARAVIIEDVVASGSSTARAIQALLAETGMRVAGVQSIANWNFPEMRARLASWTVRALTSYPQVLASAQEAGLVSAADVSELLRFYADPRGHSWNVAGEPSRRALCRAPQDSAPQDRGPSPPAVEQVVSPANLRTGEAVLFDLYDTLVHAAPDNSFYRAVPAALGVSQERWLACYRALGSAAMRGEVPDMTSRVHLACDRAGQPRDRDAVASVVRDLLPLLYAGIEPDRQALAALDDLRAAGVRLAIVSNAARHSERLLDTFGFRDRVSATALSWSVGVLKPDRPHLPRGARRARSRPRRGRLCRRRPRPRTPGRPEAGTAYRPDRTGTAAHRVRASRCQPALRGPSGSHSRTAQPVATQPAGSIRGELAATPVSRKAAG